MKRAHEGPFWNVLALNEINANRFIAAALTTSLLCGLITLLLGWVVVQQSKEIRFLTKQQVVHVYPKGDGVFLQEVIMPNDHIASFVTWFDGNRHSFDPKSIETNFNESLRMMSPALRLESKTPMERDIARARQQGIYQTWTRTSEMDIQPSGDGFIVRYQAESVRFVLQEPFRRQILNVELDLRRVTPGKAYPWGLFVDRITLTGVQ